MIKVFRTKKGFNQVKKNEWFYLRDPATSRATPSTVWISEGQESRGDIIFKGCMRLDANKFFFTKWVAQEWKGFPDMVRNQKFINAFKNRYDKWKKQQRDTTNTRRSVGK